MQDKQLVYDWLLPPYKPLHVSVNTGSGCGLILSPRDYAKLEEESAVAIREPQPTVQKPPPFSCSLLAHLQQLPCAYRKFEPVALLCQKELNYNFTRLSIKSHGQRALVNQALANGEFFCSTSDIKFDSSYESGNLYEAYEFRQGVYHLVLQNDSQTFGFASWFNFRVQNLLPQQRTVRFSVINMRRRSSLHQQGMAPLVYTKEGGWNRVQRPVFYYANGLTRQIIPREYYSLEWSYSMEPLQQVCFTSCLPYTYCDLLAFLSAQRALTSSISLSRTTLCTSSMSTEWLYIDNKVEMMSITERSEQLQGKKQILILGRVHPEETASSFLVEAVIKYLLSDGYIPGMLRKSHTFHIVPMLNPDGVVLGNSRCSALGKDLNRMWSHTVSAEKCPQVFYLKQFVSERRDKLKLVLDFHGHFKKKGCFVYGGHSAQKPYQTRELPYFLSHAIPEYFAFRDCGFCLGKTKSGSARKYLWEEFNILAYSVQCSAMGSRDKIFAPSDYWKLAKHILESLLMASEVSLPQTILQEKIKSKRVEQLRLSLLGKLTSKPDHYETGLRNEYSDSDSEPEDDYEREFAVNAKKQSTATNALEELSQKLRIEANLEHLIKSKCKEQLPSIRNKQASRKEANYFSSKDKARHRRLVDSFSQQQSEQPQGHSSPLKLRPHFKEYRLENERLLQQKVLYTQVDSEREKIEAAIQRSRSEKKKIEVEYLRLENQAKRHSSVMRSRKSRMLTLPNELEHIMENRQKRQSNLMDSPHQRVNAGEFVQPPWLPNYRN